jgi:hypothetical protein
MFNRFMNRPLTYKLSKLQKFILLKALEGLERAEKERAEKNAKEALTNPERALVPGSKVVKAEVVYAPGTGTYYLGAGYDFTDPHNLPHVTRGEILMDYFDLWPPAKKNSTIIWGDENFDTKDYRYRTVNSSFYRALDRLVARGLIQRRSREKRDRKSMRWVQYQSGDLWLTKDGVEAARNLARVQAPCYTGASA